MFFCFLKVHKAHAYSLDECVRKRCVLKVFVCINILTLSLKSLTNNVLQNACLIEIFMNYYLTFDIAARSTMNSSACACLDTK